MNEVQGPTPTGTSRPYRSLAEALRHHRIAVENHEFIAAITDAVGISSYIDRGRYIEAIRRGDGANLHIGRTYTNGFAEHETIVVGATPVRLRPSEGRAPYLYATHPSELRPITPAKAARSTASSSAALRTSPSPKRVERDYGVCDVCFMVRTPAGGCGCGCG